MGRELRRFAGFVVVAVATLGITQSASAATIVVPCTTAGLIASITSANSTPAADTLELNAGCTYTLTAVNVNGGAGNTIGLPIVTQPLTINGNGATITRGGATEFRLLYLNTTAAVAINNVTLSNGKLTAASAALPSLGAGIFNGSAALTLTNVTMKTNSVVAGGSFAAYGGAIYAYGGTTTVTGTSSIESNTASTAGGAIASTGFAGTPSTAVSVTGGATVKSNLSAFGGAFYTGTGSLTLDNANVNNNSATLQGGALYTGAGTALTVSNGTTVSTNSAGQYGGGFYAVGGSFAISGATFSGNTATIAGGAITTGAETSATINGSTFSANKSLSGTANQGLGGAIWHNTGALSIGTSSFTGNQATTGGGAIYATGSGSNPATATVTSTSNTFSTNSAVGQGGAVYASVATFNATGGAFTSNTSGATGGGAISGAASIVTTNGTDLKTNTTSGSGGAAILSGGSLTITGGLVDANATTSTGYGGAIYAASGAATSVKGGATVSNNSSPVGFGGAILQSGGTLSTSGVTFTANSSGLGGGAITTVAAPTTITSTEFGANKALTANASVGGGALLFNGGTITIDSSNLHDNQGFAFGGAIYQLGNANVTATGTTFTSNKATATTAPNGKGGAIYAVAGSGLTLQGSTFTGNEAYTRGGAIDATSTSAGITATSFANNKATGTASNTGLGGAISVAGGVLHVTGGTHQGNVGLAGGVIAADTSAAVLVDGGADLKSNTGTLYGGAIYAVSSTLGIDSATIEDNSSFFGGGGIAAFTSATTLKNLTLDGNDAIQPTATLGVGGGLLLSAGTTTIESSTVKNNTAYSGGGGVYVGAGTPFTATTTTFDHNSSNTAVSTLGTGGAIYALAGSTVTLDNSTLSANTAFTGGGAVHATATTLKALNGTTFTGNIATGSGGAIDSKGGSVLLDGGTHSANGAGAIGGVVYGEPIPASGPDAAVPPTVTVTGATLTGNGAGQLGAGVYVNTGTLDLSGSSITTNNAPWGGAAVTTANAAVDIDNTNVTNNTSLQPTTNLGLGGGYLFNGGSATIDGGTIANNSAYTGGGGIYASNGADIDITDANLISNSSTTAVTNLGLGGGIYALTGANVDLDGVLVQGNSAYTGGGGIYGNAATITAHGVTNFNVNTAAGCGGAAEVVGGSLTLGTDVSATSNTAQYGGALCGANATIVANGSDLLTNTASIYGGGVYVLGGSFAGDDTTISGNSGAYGGGAVASAGGAVTLDGATVSANKADAPTSPFGIGGAIFANTGTIDVSETTIADNTSYFAGAGIYALKATTTVDASTITGNASATSSGAALVQGGLATVTNSTITGNTSGLGLAGFTVVADGASTTAGRLDLASSTVADNGKPATTNIGNALAVNGAGGGASAHLTDTIIADSDSTTVDVAQCATSNGGTIVNDTGNLEFPTATCGVGAAANPKLGPLANNGGPTQTRKLLPGSAAIDRGGATCPTTDQRGVARPGGDACDAGAYETEAPETAAVGPASPTNAPSVTFSSPDSPVTFECRVDGGAWVPCTSPFTPTLPSGSHTVDVRAVDADGYFDQTPASVTFTVDVTAPVVQITSFVQLPTNPATAKATFTVDGTATTVTCKLDANPAVPCSNPFTTGPLTVGSHSVTVTAADALGNSASATASVVIDVSVPDTTITGGPNGTIYTAYTSFTFTSNKPGSTFECRIDSGAWAPCTSGGSVTGYAPGFHTFAVRAVGVFGADPTPATRTFTYQKCNLLYTTINLLGQPVTICL